MKKLICFILILFTATFSSVVFLSIGDSVSKLNIFWQLNISIAQHGRGWTLVSDTSKNNTSSTHVMEDYDTIIGDETFDYLILNYGLHDAANMHDDTVVGTELFRVNTCIIADSLAAHNKKIIWCHTTPMLGLTGETVWGKDMEFWDDLQPRLDSIAHHIYDSIVGAENMIYVDQWSFCKKNVSDYDSVHLGGVGTQSIAINLYDTICKYLDTAHLADPEWSSYGITAPDTNTTGMAEYSSYGIDACGYNNYWRGGAGYADSTVKWSNENVPDSLDNLITLNGGNKLQFTAGVRYNLRALNTSGTAGSPDSIVCATLGSQDTLAFTAAAYKDTISYAYIKDQYLQAGDTLWCNDGTCVDGGGNSGNIVFASGTTTTHRHRGIALII